MLRKIFFALVLSTVVFFVSCTNDNYGYREYFHPMGNNPVQVVPWLKSVRKFFLGKEARISLYELDEKRYFTTQVFLVTDSLPVSPFTIYEDYDDEGIVYLYVPDSFVTNPDTMFVNFIEKADLVNVLWSNEKKYSLIGGD